MVFDTTSNYSRGSRQSARTGDEFPQAAPELERIVCSLRSYGLGHEILFVPFKQPEMVVSVKGCCRVVLVFVRSSVKLPFKSKR